MFKFLGHTHFLEVWAASQEIMLFHDNGFVLLRSACGFNESSMGGSYRVVFVDWKVGCIPPQLGGYSLKIGNFFPGYFIPRSFGDEFDIWRHTILSYIEHR